MVKLPVLEMGSFRKEMRYYAHYARFARAWYTGYLYTVLHPRISQEHSKHPTVRQSNLVLKQIGTL